MKIHQQNLNAGQARAAGASEAGVRPDNEDAMLIRPDLGLYIVCDGMGGHGHGDVAAAHAIQGVEQSIAEADHNASMETRVKDALEAAAAAVRSAGQAVSPDDPIGTTLTMILLSGARMVCGHVGDSRLYRLRDKIDQLSRDHNLAEELRAHGVTDRRTLRTYEGVLTHYLGSDKHSDGDVFASELRDGDRFLLCSDGLNVVPPESLELALGHDLVEVPDLLLDKARHFSSLDNVTALVVTVELDH